MSNIGGIFHHNHDELLTIVYGPEEVLAKRIEDIKALKPQDEQPLRLCLIKVAEGELPRKLVRAWEARWGAWKSGRGEAYKKAREAYYKALADSKDQIEALHGLECPDCPWDGETIFSEKEGR